MADPKGKPEYDHKGVKEITVEKHPEGFVMRMHHEQKERGVYKEPRTVIAKNHGEVMHHVHEVTKNFGAVDIPQGEHECPYCEEEADEEGKVTQETKGKKDGVARK